MTLEERQELWLNRTIEEIRAQGGRVVEKKGWFWRILHKLVVVVTFGGNRNFLKGYYTTIGGVVGCPEGWEKSSLPSIISVLEHELIHIKQCKKFGLGSVWLGLPLYTIFYLLLPLPMGLAYFRWRFEREAYAHGINIRVHWEPQLYDRLIDNAVKQLTSGAYGWTWPFKSRVYAYLYKHCERPV
jgi:hypothetical protein